MTNPKPGQVRTWTLNTRDQIFDECEMIVPYAGHPPTPGEMVKVVPLEDYTKLKEQAEMLAKALEDECWCPGKKDYLGKEIKCVPCEIMAKYNKFKEGL